jgi:hypothetical protein
MRLKIVLSVIYESMGFSMVDEKLSQDYKKGVIGLGTDICKNI